MDNDVLPLGLNKNFSIASLITSYGYNDENHLFHSMTNSIGTNLDFNHYSIEKITHDYYPNPPLIDTSHEQYPTQIKKKENRTKTHQRKRTTTKGHMEGQ